MLIPTDFPEPVVPAINKCGILDKLAIIGSENPLHFNCVKNKNLCHFISNEKDTLKEAKNLGFEISTILNDYYDIIVLELTKSKETNLGLIALAEECLKDGGQMIINGDNRIGIKSFLQNISNQWPPEITLIKKKGRIALYQKKNQRHSHTGTGTHTHTRRGAHTTSYCRHTHAHPPLLIFLICG